MGEVYVELDMENFADRVLADQGYLDPGQVRAERVKALVDTRATLLVLPQDLVEALGLKSRGKAIVTYADERKEEREIAGVVTVKVGNRSMNVDCIVGPPRSEPLVGHIVLEGMDLIVDATAQKLVPRPESPYLPMLKLK